MRILLILIMVAAAIMITTYFIMLFTRQSKMLIAFRIAMLCLIALLIISWITSIVLKQHFPLLLLLAIVFIIMYIFS